jgi:tetrahydromethanopterin S-methyltransferase subunit A
VTIKFYKVKDISLLLLTSTTIKKKLEDVAGRICEVVIPIKHEYYMGQGRRIAVCTLSSLHLLQSIARTDDIMNRILIVGRLLSENKGIDTLVRFTLKHPELRYIIVCGRDVKGHQSGQALLSLHKNGTGKDNRIVGAAGPYPFLTHSHLDIESFRKQIVIYDLIGCDDLKTVKTMIDRHA